MPVAVFADVEGGLRAWLRGQPSITALVDQHVWFGIPANAQFPLITIAQVGGGPGVGEAPITDALIQLDCWGAGQNKGQAAAVMTAVLGALDSLHCGAEMGGEVIAMGSTVESVIWLPDPQSNQARYVVTALVSAKAKTA